jgi:hypothetical protein
MLKSLCVARMVNCLDDKRDCRWPRVQSNEPITLPLTRELGAARPPGFNRTPRPDGDTSIVKVTLP